MVLDRLNIMSLLPDIDEEGQLILDKDEKKFLSDKTPYPVKKARLKEMIERIKAKKVEEGIIEESLALDNSQDLNNMGHKEITPDFSDSPFADRAPIVEEVEDNEPEEDEETTQE